MVSRAFNNLDHAEAERLAILNEECAEVCQAISKVLRHGYHSLDPTNHGHGGNRRDLETECGQVIAIINLMMDRGDLDTSRVMAARIERAQKRQYMHHQE